MQSSTSVRAVGSNKQPTHFVGLQVSHCQQVSNTITSLQAALVAHTPGLSACITPASTAHISLVALHLPDASSREHAGRLLCEQLRPLLEGKGITLRPFRLQLQGLVAIPETPQVSPTTAHTAAHLLRALAAHICSALTAGARNAVLLARHLLGVALADGSLYTPTINRARHNAQSSPCIWLWRKM